MTALADQNNRATFYGVFLVGFLCLSLELIQVRMLSFFLGAMSNFLAIPVALLGLALGSLFVHLVYRGDRDKLAAAFSVSALPVLVAMFLAFFYVADTYFSVIHMGSANPANDVVKLVVYSGLFLVPYFLFGSLLTIYFSKHSDMIGRLYFYDLTGAALGCLVTPLMFTYTDLPPVIAMLLFGGLLLTMNTPIRNRMPITLASIVLFAVFLGLIFSGRVFKEHPDAPTLGRILFQGEQGQNGVEEMAVVWNDLARTSLLRSHTNIPRHSGSAFTVVQDDGLSNVQVVEYDIGAGPETNMVIQTHAALPYLIGQSPKKVLVMFAGAGRDMVAIDNLAQKGADITGVEINQAVIDMILHPITIAQNMRNFAARDNIHFVVKEGRDFLNTDKSKYDLIYIATNGSVFSSRTGHTRKYLDTYEAMRSYTDHLQAGGMMIFVNQPVEHNVVHLRRISQEQGLGDFSGSVYAFGPRGHRYLQSLVFKPDGLTRAQVTAMDMHIKARNRGWRAYYSPFGGKRQQFETLVRGNVDNRPMITDDNPYVNKLDLEAFELLPDTERFRDHRFASDWVKIFTVILFAAVSLLVILIARFAGGRERRLPLPWLAYFLLSGVAYMCVEIGLIAKIELFMGNPFYAVAVILALFLASNGIGAYLQERMGLMKGWKSLAGFTLLSIAFSIFASTLCNKYGLSLPMGLKILCVAVAVLPAGICLGTYYPLGVSRLVDAGLEKTVPVTYGMATISSVLGSAAAMTAVISTGFSVLIAVGAAVYLACALVFLLLSTLSRRVA